MGLRQVGPQLIAQRAHVHVDHMCLQDYHAQSVVFRSTRLRTSGGRDTSPVDRRSVLEPPSPNPRPSMLMYFDFATWFRMLRLVWREPPARARRKLLVRLLAPALSERAGEDSPQQESDLLGAGREPDRGLSRRPHRGLHTRSRRDHSEPAQADAHGMVAAALGRGQDAALAQDPRRAVIPYLSPSAASSPTAPPASPTGSTRPSCQSVS